MGACLLGANVMVHRQHAIQDIHTYIERQIDRETDRSSNGEIEHGGTNASQVVPVPPKAPQLSRQCGGSGVTACLCPGPSEQKGGAGASQETRLADLCGSFPNTGFNL